MELTISATAGVTRASCRPGWRSVSNLFSIDSRPGLLLIGAMRSFLAICLSTTAVWSALVGCSAPTVDYPAFDGSRAFEYLRAQVEFGPRVSGSKASADCRRYFYRHFSERGMKVDSQAFTFYDPYSGRDTALVNVIASIEGSGSDRILLMAHYDSRPRTDYASDASLSESPIDGANDGASGVAVLMELANLMAKAVPPCSVDIVLVDGEDWGKGGDHDYYFLGSREFSRRITRDSYRFGIVVDMVGDKSQQIYREVISDTYARSVNDMVFQTAQKLGVTTFIDSVKHAVKDDHLPLNVAGVATVDLIDFDYPYWHTEFDTVDKCSAESLANVGKVLAEIVYNRSIWPKK